MLRILPEGEKIIRGGKTRRIWSLVYKDNNAHAVYYAELPNTDRNDFQINFYIILGKWGEGASEIERFLVTAAYRNHPQPGFMITDPDATANEFKSLASQSLSRNRVIMDVAIKESIFELLDEVCRQDKRIKWKD